MREAVVTIKDHKPNYRNNTKTRLINPTKSYLGKVSKIKLARIIHRVRVRSGLCQWKNTDSVIDWFKGLTNKPNLKFIQFDIVSYYPRITEDLLERALDWAGTIVEITREDKDLFMHTKLSLLYDGKDTWIKKGDRNFDVGMGSYDGAETCDIVGLFLLSQLQHLPLKAGLYRDDGLGVCDLGARQVEKLKQQIVTVFGENGLEITAEANLQVVDILDVTLDLRSDSYRPFMKPNDLPLYVHVDSNHPTTTTRCIPSGVQRRLSKLSSSKEMFDAAKGPYQEALARSGYTHQLEYEPGEEAGARRHTRSRRITWFNPPYCKTVKTKVGNKFLKLIDSCFPPGHPLHKTINRSTVKLSYRTMPSLGKIIAGHNRKVLYPPLSGTSGGGNEGGGAGRGDGGGASAGGTGGAAAAALKCNCRKKPCPMEGERCREKEVVYQAKVTSENGTTETYLGLSATEWKLRYNNHTASFKHRNQRTKTCLSKHIWELKDAGVGYTMGKWKIVAKGRPFSPSSNCCRLCLKEKYLIMHKPELGTLNKRQEFFNSCRHKTSLLLSEL